MHFADSTTTVLLFPAAPFLPPVASPVKFRRLLSNTVSPLLLTPAAINSFTFTRVESRLNTETSCSPTSVLLCIIHPDSCITPFKVAHCLAVSLFF